MGTFAFKLPDIGEGVVEGEVVEWMVAVGDTVKEDDPILSVMTDKATVEIPAPCDGTVTKIIGEAGDILPVGVVCIEFEVDGDGNASASEAEPEAPAVEENLNLKQSLNQHLLQRPNRHLHQHQLPLQDQSLSVHQAPNHSPLLLFDNELVMLASICTMLLDRVLLEESRTLTLMSTSAEAHHVHPQVCQWVVLRRLPRLEPRKSKSLDYDERLPIQ